MTDFYFGEPARPATCEIRSVVPAHGVPLRASAGVGLRVSDVVRFAAAIGAGLDLVRIERACREGTGLLPDKPHLRTTFGPWLDAAFAKDRSSLRPALHFAFGRHDVGWLRIPEWEVFAIVGAARTQETWASSASVGARLVFLQAELRADLSNRERSLSAFVGVHFDPSAW